MKSMRDYINLVETAMTESKNKQDFEHHRDMAKLATDPGRRAIHAAKATKAGQRWDNEKKQANEQGVAEGLDKETLRQELEKINQQMKLNHPRYNNPNSPGHTDRYFELMKKRDAIIAQLKQGVAEEQLEETTPDAVAKV